MVDPAIIGAGISAAGNLAGGILGMNATKKANSQSLALAQEQMAWQKKLANKGIRMRVDDAKAAGIHPLYALGAQVPTYAPVSTAFGSPNFDFVGRMGQDLGRAAAASMTPKEVQSDFVKQSQRLTLQNMDLRNKVLAAQLARTLQSGQKPVGVPAVSQRWLMPGQGETAVGSPVKDTPMQRTVADIKNKHSEPGAVVDVGYARTANGGYAPVMSKDAKERLEEDWIGGVMWNLRNRFPQTFGFDYAPPFKAPPGKRWVYNSWKQEYQLITKRQRYGPASYAPIR